MFIGAIQSVSSSLIYNLFKSVAAKALIPEYESRKTTFKKNENVFGKKIRQYFLAQQTTRGAVRIHGGKKT